MFHLSFVDLVFLSACMQLFGSRGPLACIRRPLVLGCAPSLSGVSQLLSVCFPADWLQRGATPAASPASVPRPPSCCSSPGRSSETARLSGLSSIALPCWCPSFRAVRIGGSRSVSCAVACLSTPSDYGQPVRLSFLARSPSCRLCEQIALRVVRHARLARGHATLPLTKKNSVRCPAVLTRAVWAYSPAGYAGEIAGG